MFFNKYRGLNCLKFERWVVFLIHFDDNQKIIFWWCLYEPVCLYGACMRECSLKILFDQLIVTKAILLSVWIVINYFCRKLTISIFYWSSQTCSMISRLFLHSVVTMLKKTQSCPISDFFNMTSKYFLPLLPYTDLVPPSTDPVPPSTNHYRPSTTKYQPVTPSTDPVPSYINHYRPLLIQ